MSTNEQTVRSQRCALPLVELASGVDSLYVSGRCDLATDLLADLELSKLEALEHGGSIPYAFGGYDWQLKASALHRYRYRLDHPLVTLGLTPSDKLPALFAQFRSEGIHSLGADGVVHWLRTALGNADLSPTLQVSRIDLHADWQNWTLTGDHRHRFVCRSRDLTTYEDDFELTGFSFGNRKTKTLTARIYDKTREIDGNGHDWWHAIWGDDYIDGLPVLRTEFEFARAALNDMDLSDPTETIANVDRLWAYATQQWLTYRKASRHSCAHRWPIAPEWEQIQNATLAGDAIPMDRITAGRRTGELRRLMPGLNGYVAGFASWTGHDTIGDACAALPEHLQAYERTSRRSFCSRVTEKRDARQ